VLLQLEPVEDKSDALTVVELGRMGNQQKIVVALQSVLEKNVGHVSISPATTLNLLAG